ncbi:MAG TPA: DUF1302 family protein [Polyangiaceae bacterium]|nr:DUF1302 family protein [Polyangiaceae bacterium]
MSVRACLFIASLSCVARSAAAQSSDAGLFERSQSDASVTSSAAGEGGVRRPTLHGYTRADVFAGKAVGRSRPEFQATYAELALRLGIDDPGVGDAHAEVRVRSGLDGVTPGPDVDLREAYVNLYLGKLDLRVGQQIIVWGRADAFNPTNNLTPTDLRVRSPVEDDRRLGSLAARLWFDLAPLRLEGVWLPVYAASEIPSVGLPEFVSSSEPRYPGPALSNGLGALRVHLELPAIEASASYLLGHAPLPGLALRDYTVGVDPPVVRIARAAYRQHVVGADFSTALGELVAIRGEAAYRRPIDYEDTVQAPRPDLQYVLGVEHDFGPVSVIAQYLGRYVFDWQRETGPAMPLDPLTLVDFMEPLPIFLRDTIDTSIEDELRLRNQILFVQRARVQHLASLRVEWRTLNDTLSLSALGLVNFTTREWLLYPKVAYSISDWMSVSVGAELYAGPDGSLFDLIEDRLSAGYAELRLSF